MTGMERLGIQIYLDLSDLGKGLNDIKSKMADALNTSGAADKAQKDMKGLTDLMKAFASQAKLNETEMRGFIGAFSDVSKIQQWARAFKDIGTTTDQAALSMRALSQVYTNEQRQQVEAWKLKGAAAAQVQALIEKRDIEDASARGRRIAAERTQQYQLFQEKVKWMNEERRIQLENEKQLASIAARSAWKNNSWGTGISKDEQMSMGSMYVSGLSRQGYTTWDNGTAKNTAELTAASKKAADALREEAKAKQESEKAARSAATGNNFLNMSLVNLVERLASFYSVRTVMFAVASQIREATAAAIDLNQSVHDILAISGESKNGFGAISDSIYDIAKHSRFTTGEVSGLMQVLAQAGVKSKDLAQVSAEVGRFATATATAPALAADLVTTSMNTFGIEAGQVGRITNALTAALNQSKLESQGLATAFNYLAPQAAQLGRSMEETLGIIATMAQSGIKASTIGTGVSQMLKEFAAPKKRLRDMLSAYKIDAEEINPLNHSFAEIVERLQQAKVSVADLFQAMETRVGRAAVTAINLTSSSFREMTDNVTGTKSALIAYDKSMEGSRAQMNVVKQSFQELATMVGEAFAPVIWVSVEALKGMLVMLRSADGLLAKLVVGFAAIAGPAALAFASVSKFTVALEAATAAGNVSNLMALGAAFTSIAGKIGSFITGGLLLATGTGAIVAGIAAVTAAVVGVAYAFNHEKREQEEATKAALERTAQNESLDRSLVSVINSDEKLSKAYARYMELQSTGKGLTKEANKLKNTQIELSEAHRKELAKYMADGGPFAQYLNGLMKEGATLQTIIALRGKKAEIESRDAVSAINKYNTLNSRTRAEARAQAATYHQLNPNIDVEAKTQELYNKTTQSETFKAARQAALEGSIKDARTLRTIRTQSLDDKGYVVVSGVAPPKKPNDGDKPPKDDKAERTAKAAAAKAEREAESAQKILDGILSANAKLVAKFEEGKATLDREAAEEELKRLAEAGADTNAKKLEVQSLLDKEYAAKRKEEYVTNFEDLARKLNGYMTKDAKGNYVLKYDSEKFSEKQANEAVTSTFNTVNSDINPVNAKYKKDTARIAEEARPHLESYNSDREEKIADKTLKVTTAKLALDKEQATTADQVNRIELKQLQAEIECNQQKDLAYQKEIAAYDLAVSQEQTEEGKNKLIAEQGTKIAAIRDKHEEILLLLEAQQEQYTRESDNNLWNNIYTGATNSIKAMGAVKDNSEKLGETLTTTFSDGVESSIISMSDALSSGGNAWKSFGKSIKNTLKDMLNDIQKFVVHAAVKKLMQMAISGIGSLFGGSTASDIGPTNANASSISGSSWLDSFVTKDYTSAPSWANGGLIQRFAAGGLALTGGDIPTNIGTPGVDSVPAMLMPGEFVVRKSVVDRLGVEYFKKLNAQHFADGGLVGNAKPTESKAGTTGEFILQIVNVVREDQIPTTSGQQILNEIALDAARNGATFRMLKAAIRS